MKAYQRCQKSGPRWLPTTVLYDAEYFVDGRLREFRRVDNPYERIDFDSPEGRAHLETIGIIYCSTCSQEICVKPRGGDRSLCCPVCGERQG